MSRNHGGERYVKSFDGWHHLLTMLYAVILRFDSLREIEASMLAEVRKWGHLGLKTIPRRSTLSDANSRRSEKFFEDVYRDLYEANKVTLSSDSRRNGTEAWINAITHYHVDREEDGHTWITMQPLTGRAHQLRMHCAHKEGLNTPILGDPLYGRKSDRLYLHAEYLEFNHPTTGKRVHFENKAPWIE